MFAVSGSMFKKLALALKEQYSVMTERAADSPKDSVIHSLIY